MSKLVNEPNKAFARFNARLPETQKKLFEQAAFLGGYRNLTDFILGAAQEKAKAIITEHAQLLGSEKDAELFFKTIIKPPQPNKALKKALKSYDAFKSTNK